MKKFWPELLVIAIAATCCVVMGCPSSRADQRKPDAVVDAAPRPIVEGIYYCCGRDPDGKPYAGVATIHRKNATYVLYWLNGSILGRGTGVRIGDSFSVGWESELVSGKPLRGVTVYRLGSDGRLCGRWVSVPGDGQAHEETLELLRAFPAKEE